MAVIDVNIFGILIGDTPLHIEYHWVSDAEGEKPCLVVYATDSSDSQPVKILIPIYTKKTTMEEVAYEQRQVEGASRAMHETWVKKILKLQSEQVKNDER